VVSSIRSTWLKKLNRRVVRLQLVVDGVLTALLETAAREGVRPRTIDCTVRKGPRYDSSPPLAPIN